MTWQQVWSHDFQRALVAEEQGYTTAGPTRCHWGGLTHVSRVFASTTSAVKVLAVSSETGVQLLQ